MRNKSDPMLPYTCYGLDDFRHEYEALAKVDPDGCWYKRDEVDAELSKLRDPSNREPPHCPTCECGHTTSQALKDALARVAELEKEMCRRDIAHADLVRYTCSLVGLRELAAHCERMDYCSCAPCELSYCAPTKFVEEVDAAFARITALEAERDALRKDAERYRWLRTRINWRDVEENFLGCRRLVRHWTHYDYRTMAPDYEHVDDYIDAARKKEKS